MNSRLVNVRLDEERLQKARMLRQEGVPLSEVIREAIDQRFELLNPPGKLRDVGKIMRRVFELHPDPPGTSQRGYDIHDRKAAREAIVRKLQRRTR
jgi:hypothetical protein